MRIFVLCRYTISRVCCDDHDQTNNNQCISKNLLILFGIKKKVSIEHI